MMLSDPFIFHAVRSWLDPVDDPFTSQVKTMLANPEWTGKVAEACAVAHHHRIHPTYYIKGDGEVDIAIVEDGTFQPIEVKWTGRITRRRSIPYMQSFSRSKQIRDTQNTAPPLVNQSLSPG